MQISESNPPALVGLSEGLGAAVPKRMDVALWGNIVLLHLWGAVGYLKPGWFPAAVGAAQLVILVAMMYQDSLTARLEKTASDEGA